MIRLTSENIKFFNNDIQDFILKKTGGEISANLFLDDQVDIILLDSRYDIRIHPETGEFNIMEDCEIYLENFNDVNFEMVSVYKNEIKESLYYMFEFMVTNDQFALMIVPAETLYKFDKKVIKFMLAWKDEIQVIKKEN